MIGETISHYTILAKLGEGGMGVVYKAKDLKLDRLVALKFLPFHLTAHEAEQTRFLQEAKAASALNHPNVCTIYGIGEHVVPDGTIQQFIEMEYVDGVTLREKIGEAGLKIDDALIYAIQVGEALAEAHTRGIIHRDIKSENIMVNSRNQIKVMDFGLAKLKGSLNMTRTSSTAGTLAYMAPEQIQGGEADTRSDIFSFGIVLYEMLTGHTPFRGEHEAAIMYSIVNEEPVSAATFRNDLPAECLHVLGKALEKDPEDRYQHAVDMIVDLRRMKKQSTRVSRSSVTPEIGRADAVNEPAVSVAKTPVSGRKPLQTPRVKTSMIAGGILITVLIVAFVLLRRENFGSTGPGQGKKMLAVLPFENLGAPDQEYFADGLTEEITNRLSGLSGLGVIARTSAMQYKKTAKTLQQIGGELGVGYVLQGTIRWGITDRGGKLIRVSPALIKVDDGTQVWAESYDAVFSDVFKMQSDIASNVAGALGVTLLQPERTSLAASHTENSDAYDFYLRGTGYIRRSYKEQDIRIGIEMLEKAVGLDSRFALAYARLSEANSALYWFHYDHTKERLAKAKAAVDEALKLDPDLPEAHASLGYYYYWGFLDYDHALRELELAGKSRPSDARIPFGIGAVQRRQGKFEQSLETMTKAIALDPRSSELAFNISQTYALLRNYPEAERYIDKAMALSPDVTDRYLFKAQYVLAASGDTRTARALMQLASSIAGQEEKPAVLFVRAWIEMFDGKYNEAYALAASKPDSPYDDQFQFIPRAQLLAEIYGLVGKHDLERAKYDSARGAAEQKIKERPDDARFHSALGIAYAGLGRKQDAIREGKRGVELLPVAQEAWRGTYRVRDLARIYTMAGEQEAALDLLTDLLSRPSDLSAALLRIDPIWAPLRDNPRFQKLIARHG